MLIYANKVDLCFFNVVQRLTGEDKPGYRQHKQLPG